MEIGIRMGMESCFHYKKELTRIGHSAESPLGCYVCRGKGSDVLVDESTPSNATDFMALPEGRVEQVIRPASTN